MRTRYDYDALDWRTAKHDAFGTTFFSWEGLEKSGSDTVLKIKFL